MTRPASQVAEPLEPMDIDSPAEGEERRNRLVSGFVRAYREAFPDVDVMLLSRYEIFALIAPEIDGAGNAEGAYARAMSLVDQQNRERLEVYEHLDQSARQAYLRGLTDIDHDV